MNNTGRIKKTFFLICSLLIFASGALSILRHFWASPWLNVLTDVSPVNPFTAIAFMAIGNWMYLRTFQPEVSKLLYYPALIITSVISLLKIAELTGIFPIHFDRFFFLRSINSYESFDGISPPSAFLLLLCAIVILTLRAKRFMFLLFSDLFKILGFLTAYLVIIGYIFGLSVPLAQVEIPTMALSAAVGYLSFFSFCILAFPHGPVLKVFDSPYIGGGIARKTVPFVLVIPVLAGYLHLMSENALLTEPLFATALLVLFTVFIILAYVYVLASKLNKQDKLKHLAENKMAESEQKYRTLISALREGIVYYNNQGTVLFCNEGFSKLTGYSSAEILQKSIFDLFIKDELTEKYRERMKDRQAGISEVFEDNIKTKSGEYKWVSISASPVFNDNGEVVAALSTLVDITEKKKQLEDIEAFSASAAHDLNAPLARIEMIAMLLLETADDQLDADNLELLKAIAGITFNMRSMLKDLLDFSRLGIVGIKKNRIDTTKMVNDAITSTRHMNENAEIVVKSMPDVYGDEIMIRQVLVNLVGNALKYSSHKDQPKIEIGGYADNGTKVIYVKDNGAGFSMSQYNKLFAAFQRLHVEFEGNGLGLPIVKRIVEKHGGKIWAEGEEGVGATFYFSLP